MKAKQVNEDLPAGMWTDSNLKAVRGWADKDKNKKQFRLTTTLPLDVIIDDEIELAKIKLIFNKYRVKYEAVKL